MRKVWHTLWQLCWHNKHDSLSCGFFRLFCKKCMTHLALPSAFLRMFWKNECPNLSSKITLTQCILGDIPQNKVQDTIDKSPREAEDHASVKANALHCYVVDTAQQLKELPIGGDYQLWKDEIETLAMHATSLHTTLKWFKHDQTIDFKSTIAAEFTRFSPHGAKTLCQSARDIAAEMLERLPTLLEISKNIELPTQELDSWKAGVIFLSRRKKIRNWSITWSLLLMKMRHPITKSCCTWPEQIPVTINERVVKVIKDIKHLDRFMREKHLETPLAQPPKLAWLVETTALENDEGGTCFLDAKERMKVPVP